MPIKVLIVDDSPLMRHMLSEVINSYSDMEVVGVAQDPLIAREKIKELSPDVLTLDVEMPRMDGLTFLEKLMRLRPMPVVMVSSLTEANAETTLQALELGAVDFVTKPKGDAAGSLAEYGDILAEKIRAAACAIKKPASAAANKTAHAGVETKFFSPTIARKKVIFIGASTGGTEALKDMLLKMPEDGPPILIVQHMPEMFTKTFATRLNQICRIKVKEAEQNDPVLPGHAYVAPGNFHMQIALTGSGYVIRLNQNETVNRHRPAVDVLFHSGAKWVGKNAIAVILTGMGADGAKGIQALKESGASTFAQDQATSVIFGMPRAAIETGAIDKIVPLQEMTDEVLAHLKNCSETGNR